MANPLQHRRTDPAHRLVTATDSADSAVADFARAVARKLGRGGSPEDQLRSPLESLVERIGQKFGLDPIPYGEVRLKELRARPDYAVDVAGATVGYIELKAPGRGIPPIWRPNKHEREQWKKLSGLPNLIYTDGENWARYSYGSAEEPILRMNGALTRRYRSVPTNEANLEHLIRAFLLSRPQPPRSLSDLVRIVARLCGLLRDEVQAILTSAPTDNAYEDLSLLAAAWRRLLFPDLDTPEFADAYAQTVTFALLLARVNGIELEKVPLHEIGRQLAKKHTLIGKTFSALTDNDATDENSTIDTLRRVIGAVDWAALDDGHTNVYVELYESFLTIYDPDRRKRSGSYYTPEPVARFMVGFVDKLLKDRFERRWGFADDSVVVMDPAMGTGTFLVEVVQSVADTVDASQGKGSRPDRLRELFKERLIGFERQVAPYAVAELRLHEALKVRFDTDIPASEVRFLTNTLADPYQDELPLTAPYKVIERSREEANRIKRERRVLVVLGNPPHVGDAKKQGAWLCRKTSVLNVAAKHVSSPSIYDFSAPGSGGYESDLHALQWYFWRWALWKVFEAHGDQPGGVVAFVSPESFTLGTAFSGMREYLRRTCDEGWVIDISPEGNRSTAATRIFGEKVQRVLCIAIFVRYGQGDDKTPAVVHRLALRRSRQEKLQRLETLRWGDNEWNSCQNGWQSPFMPPSTSEWERYPSLAQLLPWRSRGITTGRSWVYAPDIDTLKRRWQELISSEGLRRKELFDEGEDRKIDSRVMPLPGFGDSRSRPLAEENGPCMDPVPVAFRSFDRQWFIPDNRLAERARTALWAVRSDRQIYISEQDVHPISSGPALVLSALIPDLHHFNVRDGGVRPLFRDRDASVTNTVPQLLEYLSQRLSANVGVYDLVAYIAAVTAHRGFTEVFRDELQRPGVHVPLTGDRPSWIEAVSLGREVVWLHSFGERFVDPPAGRPRGALALAEQSGIRLHTPIAANPPGMPDAMSYDPETMRLLVGDGVVEPVGSEVWEYDVGGMRVVRHWFDSRRASPRNKVNKTGLDSINIAEWSSHLTDELLAMLSVLKGCVALEERQSTVLTRVRDGPLITMSDLENAGICPPAQWTTKPPSMRQRRPGRQAGLY
jgi:Type ISP C-terminal specificity domain/N-6 DNA Methylase